MSSWITLNVRTTDPESVGAALGEFEHRVLDNDDAPALVLYRFTSGTPYEESERKLRDAALTALDRGAETVLGMTVSDTSDFVDFTGFDQANGQLVETDYGGFEWYDNEYAEAVTRIRADLGFDPDLGGNWLGQGSDLRANHD